MIGPVQERIPIYIAAIGPKNTALTGEIADGWIPFLFGAEHAAELRKPLDEGAARAGRDLDDGSFTSSPTVNVCLSDDIDAARDVMRPFLALYVGGMGSREKNFYNALMRRYGYEAEAERVQELYLDGKKREAIAGVSDELIDDVSLVGSPDRIRDRLDAWRESGATTLLVATRDVTSLRTMAELTL